MSRSIRPKINFLRWGKQRKSIDFKQRGMNQNQGGEPESELERGPNLPTPRRDIIASRPRRDFKVTRHETS